MNVRIKNILLIAGVAILAASCGNGKSGTTETVSKAGHPKMSAKDRLAKNNNLEKHLTWERNNLKGKVKKVTIKEYIITMKGDKEQRTLDSWGDDFYNANGYITESNSYTDDGKPDKKTMIMYDANNNDTAAYTYSADGNLAHRNVITNDSRGNEIASVSYDSKGKQMDWASRFKYDNEDNLIEMAFDNTGEGRFMDKVNYTFDENGFKTGGKSFDSGKVKSLWLCKYDEKGNYLYGAQYKADSTLISKDSSKYDADGHRLEMVRYNGDGSCLDKYISKYDNHGNRIEFHSYKGAHFFVPDVEEYDEYTYDTTGNILTKKKYAVKNGKKELVAVVEYEYLYY